MTWSLLEDHDDRYTWAPPEDGRRMWLLDPTDGSLIELSGPAVVRYPVAHVDQGLINNTAGQGWVRRYPELDTMTDTEAWELMAQVSDSENPFWDHPDVIKSGYEEHRIGAAVLAEIRDTEDPDRDRD